jgi:putative transposase
VWLYFRFSVSYRDIEELKAERGVTVTYETIRAWCYKFAQDYAKRIRARRGQLGDTWHLDEVYLKIGGRLQYLWRAVDQDGSVLDILVQPHRDKEPAARFFKKLLRGLRYAPRVVVTDRLASYTAPCAELLPNTVHRRDKGFNNRARTPISRHESERGGCEGLSQPGMPNDSCRSLAWLPICSVWAVTCCRRRTIGRL